MPRTIKTVSAVDKTLFHVAMRELGSALAWVRIAQVNGLTDPMITRKMDLIIPGPDPTPPDGLPQQ